MYGTLLTIGLVALVADMPSAKQAEIRKTTDADLGIDVERFVLDNGLVVLLSPDKSTASVLVDMSFAAGAVFEPKERAGLAHFVEHIMMRGATPDTDYIEILERRGARSVGAFTDSGLMTFRSIVPAGELPLALWVAADRIGTLPGQIDATDFDRHRSVVAVEHLQRGVDVHYGLADQVLTRRLFPKPHPLHFGVIGHPKQLAQVTFQDVKTFVDTYLRPNNGILTIIGNFDPAVAKKWIEGTVARLPPGPAIEYPKVPKNRAPRETVLEVKETLSRRPRVTMIWRLERLLPQQRDALELGALLLSNYVDGAFGSRLSASFSRDRGGGLFRLDLTLPHDKPILSSQNEAEAFLRYLTLVAMPPELYDATMLARDRLTMFALDDLVARAWMLHGLEASTGDAQGAAAEYNTRYWKFNPGAIQFIARKALIGPRLIVHARPTRPIEPKLDWELRQ